MIDTFLTSVHQFYVLMRLLHISLIDLVTFNIFRLDKEFFAHLQNELGQLRFAVSRTEAGSVILFHFLFLGTRGLIYVLQSADG